MPADEVFTQDLVSFLQASALVEHGILPDEGGLNQQAATFVDAVAVMNERIGYHKGEDRAEMQKKAKAGKGRKRR